MLWDLCSHDESGRLATSHGRCPRAIAVREIVLGRAETTRSRCQMLLPDYQVSRWLLQAFSNMFGRRTFHAKNDVPSMIVDCTISFPGKTPHVTAFTASFSVFVLKSPCLRSAGDRGQYTRLTFLFEAYMLMPPP